MSRREVGGHRPPSPRGYREKVLRRYVVEPRNKRATHVPAIGVRLELSLPDADKIQVEHDVFAGLGFGPALTKVGLIDH